jgi:hypothetical protein
MSGDLTDRIAEVQRTHERTGPPLRCVCGGVEDYRCVCHTWEECECGVVTPYDDHAAHVAERVTELRPDIDEVAEAMADADDGIIFGLLTPEEAEFYRRMAQAAITASGWSAVEQQP